MHESYKADWQFRSTERNVNTFVPGTNVHCVVVSFPGMKVHGNETSIIRLLAVSTSFGARSFSVAAPKIWNFLPQSLHTCTSLDTFRRHLSANYCQQVFQST